MPASDRSWAVLLEEAEHALEALLVVVDRLFELVLLAVVLVLVVTVDRFADLLDETGEPDLRRTQDRPADTLIELEPELMTRTVFARVGILHD